MKRLLYFSTIIVSIFLSFSFLQLNVSAQTLPDDQPVPVDPAFTEDLKGYLVTVTVKNKKSVPQVGIDVTLKEKTVKTDPNGIASFQDVPAGEYILNVSDQTSTIKVINANKAAIQDFPITFESDGSNVISDFLSSTGGKVAILLLLLILGVVLFTNRSRLKKKSKLTTFSDPTTDSKVADK